MATVCFGILFLSRNVYLLFGCALILGISNAGIRIQRVTYLFNHIPNNIIGRANSVFQSINILLRSLVIALFSLAFFNTGSGITYAFLIAAIATFLSIVPLLIIYRPLLRKQRIPD
jgi:MFS family permease